MPVLASFHISTPWFRPATLFVGDEVLEGVVDDEVLGEVGGAEGALVDQGPVADVIIPGLAAA